MELPRELSCVSCSDDCIDPLVGNRRSPDSMQLSPKACCACNKTQYSVSVARNCRASMKANWKMCARFCHLKLHKGTATCSPFQRTGMGENRWLCRVLDIKESTNFSQWIHIAHIRNQKIGFYCQVYSTCCTTREQ